MRNGELGSSNIDLYHGDCLEVMKEIDDKSIDMVLTDPPYGRKNIKEFIDKSIDVETIPEGGTGIIDKIYVPTRYGILKVNKNDYIIKGIRGLNICSPELFEREYEEVEL